MAKLPPLWSIAFSIMLASPAVAQFLPKPPDTGTPSGNPTPGTTRPEATCPETPKSLTAIVDNGKDFTLSAHPTFWFYIPYHSAQLSRLEFLLLSGNERKTIYHATIQLTNKPGVIQVEIPNEPKYALQPNQTYRWRLNLDCQNHRTVEPDLAINGWIRRIALTPQLEAQLKTSKNVEQTYRENQLWYDAIDESAKRYFAPSPSANVKQSWAELLRTLQLSQIQSEPFTSSKLVTLP